MKINDFNTDEKVLIVAEIGNNHEGSMDAAMRLVEEAAACGVDAVKFQTYRTDHFVNPSNESRYQRMKQWELSEQQFETLAVHSRQHGLLFISTPLDLPSAVFLKEIVDAFKIASGDNTFFPLIRQVCETAKPVIISTGISESVELDQLLRFAEDLKGETFRQHVALLHCVCSYPTPADQANLRSIPFLADRYNCTVGYSDHTLGISAAVLSTALGSRIIEKHFTLDKNTSEFRDHQLSADPQEMRNLVIGVREATTLLGTVGKRLQECERTMEPVVRRSIVAGRNLDSGCVLTIEDISWLRPGGGLAPGNEAELIGKRLVRMVRKGECLSTRDVA